jgi:hypothetical protein
MGRPGHPGSTPAWVIWNLLQRFTRDNDLVVDPFCGGGTTLDVARSLGRRALGYDVNPVREDVFRADARRLPLEDGKADFVFMDPPWSTHGEYSGLPECIGSLTGFDGAARRTGSGLAAGCVASRFTCATNSGVGSPPGRRVDCAFANDSGMTASYSGVLSITTGTRKGVPGASRCVRSSASFHSSRK